VTPQRWKQVEEVLDAALDRPAAERAAFVTVACAGDADLRSEVDSLLASHDQASQFLETAAVPGVPLHAFAEGRPATLAGARIGPYRIVSEIAHGGMGAVYLAERDDSEYNQQVAIKLIKSDLGSTSGVRRFRQERQILADLDHPNIARLLDGGTTEDGRPYFVMELVEGVPIDAYCDERKLAVAQRLGLFGTVCSAVAHAHRQRVVHLDLKPANILVTAGGIPKLLDFGIARLLNPEPDAQRTATAARLMTPEYASPEQLSGGPLTEASDVYALGALLFRLLTDRSPYRVGSDLPYELARAICEQEPDPPSTFAGPPHAPQDVAGDLDAIVLKALRKEPQRRYGSVEELAQDLRRHLDGRPVRARKDGVAYRAGKFVRRNRAAAITALTVAASAAVLSAVVYHGTRVAVPGAPTTPAAIGSLAVLPLANLSRDPEEEYFADGMTEALITDLSRIRSVRVVSRTSVMRYKGAEKPLPEIARELGVDGVVEGSVLRSGGRVRITAQLIRASDDRHLWAESYDRELRDVLAVQGAVAQAIASAIKGQLSLGDQERLSAPRPIDPKAYLPYARGRYLWNKRTPESLEGAITYFEQALAEDPAYAAAYSGLADAHFYLGYGFGRVPAREAMPRAKAAALKALELDETLAEAHTSLALVKVFYDWDWAGAEREFRRAIELNPNYATAHHGYTVLLAAMHRSEESVAEARRALEVDPLSLPVNNIVASMLNAAGRYDESIEQYRKTIELDPTFAMAQDNLGAVYEREGLEKQAIAQYLKAEELSGGSRARVEGLRRAYDRDGFRGFRRQKLALATAEWKGWHFSTAAIASLHASLGEYDEAMRWYEKAYEARSGSLIWINVGVSDPRKGLRADPRFQDLLRRMGLPL
jgi:TolB-like protein/Tfp pilus assembly protein PilF